MECLSPPMTETPTGSDSLLLSLFEESLYLESTVKAVMLNLCAGFSLTCQQEVNWFLQVGKSI